MGERWLKEEEGTIRDKYPTATRDEIIELIPDRTWAQIGVHALCIAAIKIRKSRRQYLKWLETELKVLSEGLLI